MRVQQVPSLARNADVPTNLRTIEELFIKHAAAINLNEPPSQSYAVGNFSANVPGGSLATNTPLPFNLMYNSRDYGDPNPLITSDPVNYTMTLTPGYVYLSEVLIGATFSAATGTLNVKYRRASPVGNWGGAQVRPLSWVTNDISRSNLLSAIFTIGPDQPPFTFFPCPNGAPVNLTQIDAVYSRWAVTLFSRRSVNGLDVLL